MCSNFQPIKFTRFEWVNEHFGIDLPNEEWRDDAYPSYPAPFIYKVDGETKCELANFGLIPHWAINLKNYGNSKYNARSETVAELKTYKSAWKDCRFGLVLMESFYEPNFEVTGIIDKSIRYRIKRTDSAPQAAACIYERVIDRATGEIIFTFSMLTVNATNHPIMKHFHRLEDEKRSIVILQESDYQNWLDADHEKARELLQLAPDNYLESEAAPKILLRKNPELF
ncbi:MAG: SOS response-associated peptidase family protein [Pseudomonadota bacterium]